MTDITSLTFRDPSAAIRTNQTTVITTEPVPAIGEIAPWRPQPQARDGLAPWALRPRHLVQKLAQLPILTAMILGFLAVDLALIAFRDRIIAVLPQTAPIYAAIGLPAGPVIEDVTTVITRRGGMPTLTIQGKITSRAPQPVDLPRLNFAILNHRGNEIVTWSTLPNRDQLAAGATMEFSSHYAVPPGDARGVIVRFSSRSGAVLGPR